MFWGGSSQWPGRRCREGNNRCWEFWFQQDSLGRKVLIPRRAWSPSCLIRAGGNPLGCPRLAQLQLCSLLTACGAESLRQLRAPERRCRTQRTWLNSSGWTLRVSLLISFIQPDPIGTLGTRLKLKAAGNFWVRIYLSWLQKLSRQTRLGASNPARSFQSMERFRCFCRTINLILKVSDKPVSKGAFWSPL